MEPTPTFQKFSIAKFAKNGESIIFRIIITSIIVSLIILISWNLVDFGKKETAENFKVNSSFQLPEWNALSSLDSFKNTRLQLQYTSIYERQKFHINIFTELYAEYYGTLAMLTLSSAILAVLVFLLTKEGWDKASFWLRMPICVLGATSIYFGAVQEIYNFDENMKAHSNLVKKYDFIGNKIISKMQNNDIEPKDLYDVDSLLMEYHHLEITFNANTMQKFNFEGL